MQTTILNKIHNLMLNCKSNDEFQDYSFELAYAYPEHKALIIELFNYGSIAADASTLPIYYLQASKATGKKQDFKGNWL